MSQQALDMPDGLRAPFYAIWWRYGSKTREEADDLYDIVSASVHLSDNGDVFLEEIGDADGFLWRMSKSPHWQVSDRAPVASPERLLREYA